MYQLPACVQTGQDASTTSVRLLGGRQQAGNARNCQCNFFAAPCMDVPLRDWVMAVAVTSPAALFGTVTESISEGYQTYAGPVHPLALVGWALISLTLVLALTND